MLIKYLASWPRNLEMLSHTMSVPPDKHKGDTIVIQKSLLDQYCGHIVASFYTFLYPKRHQLLSHTIVAHCVLQSVCSIHLKCLPLLTILKTEMKRKEVQTDILGSVKRRQLSIRTSE